MTRSTRRGALAGGIALLVAGCGDTGEPEDTDATPTPHGQTSASPASTEPPHETPVVEPETIVDDVLFTEMDYPRDVPRGTSWTIEVDVEHGGPVVVAVSSAEASEKTFSATVATTDKMIVETENDGLHYLQFFVDGKAHVTVVERRA